MISFNAQGGQVASLSTLLLPLRSSSGQSLIVSSHHHWSLLSSSAHSNAYNWSAPLEPYTGYIEVDDFLVDIMKPQMEALFYNYSADILWCDVGGPTIFQDIGVYSVFQHVRTMLTPANAGA